MSKRKTKFYNLLNKYYDDQIEDFYSTDDIIDFENYLLEYEDENDLKNLDDIENDPLDDYCYDDLENDDYEEDIYDQPYGPSHPLWMYDYD